MKTKLFSTVIVSISACLSAGCSDDTPTRSATPTPKAVEDSNMVAVPVLVDPATAALSLTAQPSLSFATPDSTLTIPQFSVAYTNADYAEVLRCRVGYTLRVPVGDDAQTVSSDRAGELKFAWADAVQSSSDCQYVGAKMASANIQDLAAKTGNYFYVLNPCITQMKSSNQSLTGSNLCSYKLVFSQPIRYENKLTNTFIEAAQKLALEEGKFAAAFSNLKFLATSIRYEQESCELKARIAAANRATFSGLVSLLSIGVQVATGAVFAGPIANLVGIHDVVGLAAKFVLGNGAGATTTCPAVQTLVTTFNETAKGIDAHIQAVANMRAALGALNEGYAKLDLEILKNNGN